MASLNQTQTSKSQTKETQNGEATGKEKENIGVYTSPSHDLWLDKAEPSLEMIEKGAGLKEGEVLVKIERTGICGYDLFLLLYL